MQTHFFFGYGSLVNRGTHAYDHAYPARLSGWRRAWRKGGPRQICYLTAMRDPDCAIDGLIAEVPGGDWAALDAREEGYNRHSATHAVAHDGPGHAEIAVYAVPEEDLSHGDDDHPILLSYLDAVCQGFLHVYGPAGLEHFFATTDGWDIAPIRDDRVERLYPRAQVLHADETAMIDAMLARHGCRIIR